jgi:hypothetical protein
MIIAPLAHVHRTFFYCMPSDESAHLSELFIQDVSVIGIAQYAQRSESPPCPAGCGQADLLAELVLLTGLTLAMHATSGSFTLCDCLDLVDTDIRITP